MSTSSERHARRFVFKLHAALFALAVLSIAFALAFPDRSVQP